MPKISAELSPEEHAAQTHLARFPAAADDVITPLRWCPVTEAGDCAAVAALRDLAAGRGDLLAGLARVPAEFSPGGDLRTGRPGPSSLTLRKTNGYMG